VRGALPSALLSEHAGCCWPGQKEGRALLGVAKGGMSMMVESGRMRIPREQKGPLCVSAAGVLSA
jgi:hypothetical protein